MSIRITLEFIEIEAANGEKFLTSLRIVQPKSFYLQFRTGNCIKEWFDERDNHFNDNEYLIRFPSQQNVNKQTMQERLESRFGSSIKIEEVNDLSLISSKGKEWGVQED
tara:strand:+ start:1088 stop:1414 length:327 start_codon:yes stop_codon:yes gene_type:complete